MCLLSASKRIRWRASSRSFHRNEIRAQSGKNTDFRPFTAISNTIEFVVASNVLAFLQSSSVKNRVKQRMILHSARKLNSRFNMMTMNDVTLNGSKTFPSFCVIFWFFKSKLFPSAVRVSAETHSLYGGFPSQSGFLEFVVSSLYFCWTICHKKHKFSIFLGSRDHFRVQSSEICFWCI